MACRVPVLRDDHGVKAAHQRIDARDDLVPAIHGKRAAGAEIILDVDDEESMHGRAFLRETR